MIRAVRILLLGVAASIAVSCSDGGGATDVAPAPLPAQEPPGATEAFGVVIGLRSNNLQLDIPAVVDAVHVTEAQLVERGDVLITLDLAEYETLLASRENRLAMERLTLLRLEQTLGCEHQRTATALRRREIELETVRAEAGQARDEYSAEERLGQKSVQQIERLLLTAENTERRVAALELELKETRVTHIAQADALRSIEAPQLNREVPSAPQALGIAIQRRIVTGVEIEIAALKRSASRPHLDGVRVIAEFDRAIVIDLAVGPGDRVDRGHLLLRLIDLDSLIIEAHVAENFIRDVQLGDPVTIIPLADPSRKSHGRVQRISGMAVYRSGETIVPVFISIEDNQGLLLPNFNVDVIIHHEGLE